MNPREFEFDRNPNDLPDTLQNLVGYRVLTPQDLAVGKVEEMVLDRNRRLYLVLSRSDVGADSALVWLPGQYIQTIEPHHKALYVNLSPDDIDRLPPYSKETETATASEEASNVKERHKFSLLEERLIVKRNRQKKGEIVVRKEIETRLVQVPLRSEKLIIEEVGSNPQLLAEIELGREEIAGIEASSLESADGRYQLTAEFSSVRAAAEALAEIARYQQSGEHLVRVELLLENRSAQQQYDVILHPRSR